MFDNFRIGITRSLLDKDGSLGNRDIGLDLLDANPKIDWEFMDKDPIQLDSGLIQKYDGILVGGRQVTESTLRDVEKLTLVSLFGAGYDVVDIDACTKAGVIVTTAPDGVKRPVASSFMAYILALSHKMFQKDRITREGLWEQRQIELGVGLKGRTLGLIGLGNIGRELLNLAKPFEMKHIAYDPYVSYENSTESGAELCDLEEVLRSADFLCISCPLNNDTYHLIDEEKLRMMKPSAFLINVARGPIVDQKALTKILKEGRIQGAGIDVFEQEPIDIDDPILTLDNVIFSPHNICMTDQCWRNIGEGAIRSILQVSEGKVPEYLVINKDVLENPKFQQKLRRFGQ